MGDERTHRLHAVRVAATATAIVLGCYVLAVIALNIVVVQRLTTQADARLSDRLVDLSRPAAQAGSATAGASDDDQDPDDEPIFVWSVTTSGVPTAVTADAPSLPERRWAAGAVTVPAGGTPFRLKAVASGSGWLVAGESLAPVDRVRDALVAPEMLFGAALVIVVFVGSILIGRRVSAPLEVVRRRQAEFTADASHELRTPLSVIEAEVELALSRPRAPDDYEGTLRRIAGEGRRLRHIVDDLLWLARFDDGRAVQHGGRLADVAAIARECVDRFQAIATARDVTLRADTGGGRTTTVHADPVWIDRLAAVLVENACKYTVPGGNVEVRAHQAGNRVVLQVDDDGPGISPDQRSAVFDRFHRGTDEPGGTGLGLAIADSVVRASGGAWSIGRSPAGGARMEVSWRKAT